MDAHGGPGLFLPVIVLLATAVFAVPVFKRLGLGSVLGYLAGGILVGPSVLGLTPDPGETMQVAELGVVFLLFIIGLELNVGRLWQMRRDIFGLGLAQIVVSAALLMAVPMLLLDGSWKAAMVAGFGLALSSTAVVVQLLEEKNALRLPFGQKAFAILLMQDLAIVPLLALVAFLAPVMKEAHHPIWYDVGAAIAAVAAIVVTGRYLLNPFLRLLAKYGGHEIMTAAALLVVIASGTLMVSVGLSMAMGAFLAGVLLAESNFRHELEANIEPFRGLLLGLFFLSVGMSIDLRVIANNAVLIVGCVIFLLALKGLVTYALVRAFGGSHPTAVKTGIYLAQAGEFGFVLFGAAVAEGVITRGDASMLFAGIVLSMAATPFMVRYLPRLLIAPQQRPSMQEDFSDAEGSILIVGFGRFGQLVSQVMLAAGRSLTLLDNDVERVEQARKFGSRVYFGDGTRPDVLRAAGADRAELVVVCTDRPETTTAIVSLLKSQFPHVPVAARAFDRPHALILGDKGVALEVRETFDSAIRLGHEALVWLGMGEKDAADVEALVRKRDRERLEYQRLLGMEEGYRKWRELTPEPYAPVIDDGAEAVAEELPHPLVDERPEAERDPAAGARVEPAPETEETRTPAE